MASRFREQNREEQLRKRARILEKFRRKRRKTASARAEARGVKPFNIMEDHPDLVVEALRIQ